MARTIDLQHHNETMLARGLRPTEQRRQVYDVVLSKRDHPTAVEVFMRAKARMPSISLATVYNCLETLTECGLVKHIGVDRGPARFCPNLEDHGHFFCERCETVLDVPLRKARLTDWELPPEAVVTQREVSLRGLCPDCATRNLTKTRPAKS